MKFYACKYLIFNKEKIHEKCELKKIHGSIGVYWHRPQDLLPDEFCKSDVQFCSKKGRLNNKLKCLGGYADCDLYENFLHVVEI